MKPLIFLDVDGVLNRFGMLHKMSKYDGDPDVYDDFVTHERVEPLDGPWAYDLRLSNSMVAEIANMDADVYWLTAWTRSAPAVVAPLCGAPEWPHVDWSPSKAHGLVEVLEELGPRPFVWIDDEEATRRGIERVRDLLSFELPEHLLIRPNPNRAITRQEMESIRHFCVSNSVTS